MKVEEFVGTLLEALSHLEAVKHVTVQNESLVVNGRASLDDRKFLAFYYNAITETIAFALIEGKKRIWGLDFDNIRGWHIHPKNAPETHVDIEPQSVSEIIQKFREALD